MIYKHNIIHTWFTCPRISYCLYMYIGERASCSVYATHIMCGRQSACVRTRVYVRAYARTLSLTHYVRDRKFGCVYMKCGCVYVCVSM